MDEKESAKAAKAANRATWLNRTKLMAHPN